MLSALALLLAVQSPQATPDSSAPQDPDVTSRFVVPDDLRVTLFADSPQLFNPTAIDVDARGRVWVAEGVNYRKWRGRNPGKDHPEGDRIVILEDTDGDGAADTSKVFAQDEDLVSPLGIAVIGDAVYVSNSPYLFIYRDTDGDDKADTREVFLEGFGGPNHDHGLHSVTFGPDGALWFNAGNAGPHVVTDKAGWTLRSGSVYVGGGEFRAPNTPGLVSDDGHAWTMGLVLRVGVDGKGLRPIAHNFRNPYEVAVDSFGDAYQSDNDDDGNRSCRTVWVVPQGDHGYASADGSRMWRADRRPKQETWNAHWHQDDPGVVPAGYQNGGGGPTGVAIYEGGLLPERFIGSVLNADAGAGVVYVHHPKSDGGSGIVFDRENLIVPAEGEAGGERPRWFRPSDVCVGADGSVYVADWFDPGVGGHAARDREAYGRILRIAPADRPDPRVDPDDSTGLKAIASPAVNVRARAWAAAESMDFGSVREELGSFFRSTTDPGERARERFEARAMWLLASKVTTDAELASLLDALARAPKDTQQLVGYRALLNVGKQRGLETRPVLEAAMNAESARVRHVLATELRDMSFEQCEQMLLALADRVSADDRAGIEMIGLAAEGKEDALFAALVAKHGLRDPIAWPEHLAEVFWRLHPPAATRAFLTRALAPGLNAEDREAAVTALAFMPDRRAAEAMAAIARGGPVDVQGLAAWWLGNRSTNLWADHGIRSGDALDIASSEVVWRSGVLGGGNRERSKQLDMKLGDADVLWLQTTDGGDGNSCDWACWGDIKLTGPAGELSVAEAPWVVSENGWGDLSPNRNAGGRPLRIGDQRFKKGIGGHAPSRVAVRIPDGYDRLVATVGAEYGGTSQGDATSLEFLVRTAKTADRSRIDEARTALLDTTRAEAVRAEMARELATDPEGGALLVRLAASDKLPAAIKAAAAEKIFSNPEVSVRALASSHFKRPGAAGLANIPPLPELAKLDGDAVRGRELFFGEKTACASCHRHRGQGMDLGPDLSEIHKKLDTTGLLDSILNPSAGIAFGYEATTIEMKDGRVFFGFLLADGPRVVIKDMGGEQHVLERDEIKTRQQMDKSLMPDTVALALEPQEIADLVAFLRYEPFDEARLGDPIQLFDGKTMDGWMQHGANSGDEPTWQVTDEGHLATTGRPSGYVRTTTEYTSYRLTLEWRFTGRPGNGGVLLRRTGPDKVWPKSIEAQLQSRSAGDIWNIDKFGMQTATSRLSGRRTQKMRPSSENPVGQWNRYELWMDGPDLRLIVNGTIQNEAWDCDVIPGHICLQSEGSAMEFRNIVLTPIER